jgi:hypothetical protein
MLIAVGKGVSMISSMVVWPIIGALMGMINFIYQDVQPVRAWDLITMQHVTQVQKDFLYRYNPLLSDLELFKPNELRTWASPDIDYLNSMLAQEGFSIRLNGPSSPDYFGVVSIMNIAVEWQHAGTVTSIFDADGTVYDAFALDKGFSAYKLNEYEYPVLCISTQTDDTVWITFADTAVHDMALLTRINQLRDAQRTQLHGYDKAIIPMIKYDETADLDWLMGLACNNYAIVEAKQQTKFKMNELGARAQSAAALGVKCCISHDLIIDKPFFVWIERPGMHEPLFVGYMDQQYWQNPGAINA